MNPTNIASNTETKSLERPLASDRRSIVLLAVALTIFSFVLYLPALQNGFVNYDDPDYVTHNAHVLRGLSWDNVVWSFSTNNPAANWHPLTWISHMADVQIYGTKSWGHHLTNVILMAADVVLLFLFLTNLTGQIWPSAAAAALFAIHPINVENVAWVAERKAVLSVFFMLLALIAYASYARRSGIARYLLVVVLFALALMSKAMIISLPFAMLLLDYWPLERIPRTGADGQPEPFWKTLPALVREKIPLFVLTFAATWITFSIHRKEGALTAAMPLSWRLKNVIYSYAVYLWKTIWPTRLAVFYPHPENRLVLWQVGVAALVLLGISALVWKYRARKYLVVGWLWYLGTAFPMIGLIQSGRQGMADRYVYLALIGAFVAVVWLAADLARDWKLSPTAVGAGFAVVTLPLVLLTHRQIGYWKDSETLFRHTLQVTAHNGIAENDLAAALMEKGDAAGAFPHFQAAVQYAPDLGSAHYNLGVLLQRQNQLTEAAAQYRLAIAHAADAGEAARAHNNLGVLFLGLGNFPAAKQEFDRAIALNPGEVNSYLARGTLEFQTGKLDDALVDFVQAFQRAPSPFAAYWIGRAEEGKGDFPKAARAYQAALEMAPGMTDARTRLESLKTLVGQ
jgi:tetratricopeptide (TPR) repeat protein